ncbi:type II secretion system protein N [uncultured Salinisphaera sp.]|uniref:type II secretion system protein N n=1 Tax=uncultured Salinisphaera sp. TaxID=359372 RepID=UPI0032B23C71|tara:strand:+ start:2850 stop:3608 length:759 start_codon:yes stop_codon:yes gene_type:complete
MNRPLLRYGLIGGLFFVIGLIIYLPASLVTGWVADDSELRFDGVTGTLLSGKAAYVALPAGGVDNVAWDIHPAALLLARITADVSADTDLSGVTATLGYTLLGNTYIRALTGDASIGWLAQMAGYTFVPAAGRVGVSLDALDLDGDMQVRGLVGRVNVSGVRYELMKPAIELGQFQADLSRTDNDALRAALVDSQGPLALTGNVDLTDQSRYTLDVRLRARAGADERLTRLLTQLGQTDEAGWYHITEQGRL